ncbi:NAD(P)/FAD-dependent oxidoreductase [Nakamurella flava]|uniref:NAD(P)/FAD-dependent oxidoreductase n=1 Tax=Nakamurella flava TaxID=2576308 RepID=A0A4V6CS48_9ACTN|nr:NAD(P)/FAD-dependent oxidoreductase [Nakamurella flava]TKV60185.1 NAD(P)/FAD-dependent oxidoreductase [Nakamurella flava]
MNEPAQSSRPADPAELFDVVVVGAGAAGLSAAVTLGRSRRSVLVLDGGPPRNAPAAGMHNYLGLDGAAPADLLAAGRAEAEHYGVHIRRTRAVGASGGRDDFRIALADGSTVGARRLIVASGVVDQLPAVPGLAARWGRDVLHCPYCHGWEVRDQAIGILAAGPHSLHQTLLFRQLSTDVIVFAEPGVLPAEAVEQLTALGVPIVDVPVEQVVVTDDRLSGVRLTDGRLIRRDALAVTTRAVADSPVLDDLGLTPAPHPLGPHFGETYPSDPMTGATSVPGVSLAGNVTDPMVMVVVAAGRGTMTGAMVNAELAASDAAARTAAARAAAPQPALESR